MNLCRNDVDYGKKRPVVFLQHGLLASSADYVLMGPGILNFRKRRGNTNVNNLQYLHYPWH